MDGTPLEESLLESVARSDLKKLAADFAEVGLDLVLDEGVVRDIPVIGMLVSLTSTAIAVRDRIFAKKLLKFLANLDTAPIEERRTQIERLAANPVERQKVGENLLLLLDRLNDMQKPAMLAKAFQAYLNNQVDRHQFQALSRVIDNITSTAAAAFKDRYESGGYGKILEPDGDVQHLLQCGLFSMRFERIDTTAYWGGGGAREREHAAGYVQVNGLATLFYEIVLRELD